MTPQQALKILDNVGEAYLGNRKDHLQIQTAVSVLANLVNKAEAEAKDPKEKAEASTPENETPASDGKGSGGNKDKAKN